MIFPSLPDIGISAGIGIDVDTPDSKDKEESLLKAWKEWTMPRIITVPFTITTINGTIAARIGEGPNQMRQWTVKRLVAAVAYPVGAAAPPAFTAYLFSDTTGLSHIAPVNLPASELRWFWNTVPILQTWVDEQNVLFAPEDLIFVINSATAGTVFGGQVQLVDEPMYQLDVDEYKWLFGRD